MNPTDAPRGMTLHSEPESAEGSGSGLRPSGRTRHWLPRMLAESLLIVFSVLFALAMDQWLSRRARAGQATIAVQSIQTELAENLQNVRRARTHHLAMRDSLRHYTALRQQPPPHIYLGGIFNPATTHSIAWESAGETGITADLPYALVLELARVYDRQTHYRALGDALVQDIMMQVRRDGMEAVLRDRAASFVALQEDFAGRESDLIEEYDRTLGNLQER